jgi:hypothetical protein
VFRLTSKNGFDYPLLVTEDASGATAALPEVASYLHDLVLSRNGHSYANAKTHATTLGLLNDYVVLHRKGEPLSPRSLPAAVSHFLSLRRFGANKDEHGFDWHPVQPKTVERDLRIIRGFSEYCVKNFRHIPLLPSTSPIDPESAARRALHDMLSGRAGGLAKRDDNRLLGHLGSKPRPPQTLGLPEKPIARGSMLWAAPPPSDEWVRRLIDETKSVSQKMAFILAAYGGPRMSEILNIWRVDVLPSSARRQVFPGSRVSNHFPLVILAHPSQSKWLGPGEPHPSKASPTRAEHMAAKYRAWRGGKTRNMLGADPYHAGWKGMYYHDPHSLLSQVVWTDLSMAEEFARLATVLRENLESEMGHLSFMATMGSHPFLIVNDSGARDEIGQPMKKSNLRKAFARAAARANTDFADPFESSNYGIHCLRHFYVMTLKAMRLNSEQIRQSVRHVSLQTQSVYGNDIENVIAEIEKKDGLPRPPEEHS